MRLKTLNISNFKGIRRFTLDARGESVAVYGANASGKTSLADAVSWLLFDKDTQDKSPLAFGIKTLDENGNPLRGEEHAVEAVFIMEGGKELSLKKIFQENWTKRRGSGETELTGHTTNYYWDEEPVKAGDYNSRLHEQIMSEQMFKMLTLPNYFAEVLHWTDRREVLTQLCGDFSDEDVINGNPALKGYAEMLDGKSQNAKEKILRERKSKLNKEIDSIPDRIDENQMKITDLEVTVETAEKSISILKENIDSKLEKISQINAGGGVAEMQVKLQGIEAEKQKAQNEYNAKVEELTSGKREKVRELRGLVDETESRVRRLRSEFTDAETAANEAHNRVKKVEDLIEQEKAKQPEPPKDENEGGPDNCPMCEQPMPEKDPAEAEAQYNKYLERFNSAKAEEIKRLQELLIDARSVVTEKQAALEDKKAEGIKAKGQLDQRGQALEKAEKELKEIAVPDFDSTPFEEKKQAIQKKIDELRGNKQEQVEAIRSEITELEKEVETHKGVISQHQQNKEIRDRIAELKDMLKKYGQDLDQTERELQLIDEFNRAKAEFITDKVNDLFEYVNWRLFKEQLNGGLTETADPVVGGVPYSEGLNNAARIKAGLDIISVLNKHFGKSAPVWIDNAESITDIPEYNNMQVLALYVSEQDSKLRVELNQESKMAVA